MSAKVRDCEGSGVRVSLSAAEAQRKYTYCAHCHRDLKVRPAASLAILASFAGALRESHAPSSGDRTATRPKPAAAHQGAEGGSVGACRKITIVLRGLRGF